MADKDLKPITINPELFKVSSAQFTNKAKTLKRNKSKVNPTNLKKELLEKIKRKSRKPKIDSPEDLEDFPVVSKIKDDHDKDEIKSEKNLNYQNSSNFEKSKIQNNPSISLVLGKKTDNNSSQDKDDDFIQSIEYLKNLSKRKDKKFKKKLEESESLPLNLETNIPQNSPKFGCLKGGNLPTFRQFHNKTVKYSSDSQNNLPNKLHSKTIKYCLGKKGKYVSVLVKNRDSRKKIIEECNRLKETKLIDMKNYLKRHNFLKSGTNAPPEIIKKMYEQCLLAGDIRNLNNKSFIQNYLAN